MLTIREMRERTGLSQSQFSRLLNIPLNTLQHWEHGTSTPPKYVNELIEKVLKYEGRIER